MQISESTSGSLSTSNSFSGLDASAKAAGDRQFDYASSRVGELQELLASLSGQRGSKLSSIYDQAGASQSTLGDADRTRIYRDFAASRNSVGNSLAGSGLYNSTVKQNMEQAVDRNRAEALGSLDESLRRQMIELMLRKAEGMDKVYGDSMQAQMTTGLSGVDVLSRKAAFAPTYSASTSNSTSTSNNYNGPLNLATPEGRSQYQRNLSNVNWNSMGTAGAHGVGYRA